MSGIDLYLDLDGVILRRTGNTEFNGRVEFDVAPGAMDFLSWAVANFHCYWLTSRSHDSTHGEIERAFRFAIPTNNMAAETKKLIRAIRPAQWGVEKVSGIDLSRDFYWIDDNPDSGSVAALEEAGKLSRLIVASTDQRSDDLERVLKLLTKTTPNQRDVAKLKTFVSDIQDGGNMSPEMAQWVSGIDTDNS
jgi:hypothetical protein